MTAISLPLSLAAENKLCCTVVASVRSSYMQFLRKDAAFRDQTDIIIDSKIDQLIASKLIDTNFAGAHIAGTLETDEDFATGIVVTQRETFIAVDLPTPADEASNGISTIRQYNIPDVTVFVETGENDTLGIFPADAPIRDYLSDWDFGDVERAVGMASFGYENEICPSDENDTDVRTWWVPNYAPDTLGAPRANFVMEDTR